MLACMAKVARAGQEKRDSRIMGEFSNYYKDDIDDKRVTSKYNCSQLEGSVGSFIPPFVCLGQGSSGSRASKKP